MMVTLSSAQPFNPNKAGFFKDSFFLGQERGDFKSVYNTQTTNLPRC